jgi:hypothetical protein
MAFADWMSHNWFPFVQTVTLAAGFVLIGVALLFDARARRVANLIRLTEQHRDLWERMYVQPELARIFDIGADTTDKAVTSHEETFVIFIILHLSTTYYAMRSGVFRRSQGLRNDIVRFFSLPIPHAVWEKVKDLQDAPFVNFVEQCFPDPDLAARQ